MNLKKKDYGSSAEHFDCSRTHLLDFFLHQRRQLLVAAVKLPQLRDQRVLLPFQRLVVSPPTPSAAEHRLYVQKEVGEKTEQDPATTAVRLLVGFWWLSSLLLSRMLCTHGRARVA